MKKIKKGGLIVSCQALEDEPLHGCEVMAKMALAAKMGGAKGIRANSPRDIQAIKKEVDLPLIGLWKKNYAGFDIYISPTFEEIRAVLDAGADYIAFDCTDRKRPEKLSSIFEKIHSQFPEKGIVADVATLGDVKGIIDLKPDFISTTMSGYTEASMGRPRPDLELIKQIKEITNIPVLAEGNYQSGKQCRNALTYGAYAVVIGTAITRPQVITKKIINEMKEI